MRRTKGLGISLALAAATLAWPGAARAQDYSLRVIAAGLQRPTGITVNARGDLFFTELPTPGVPGKMGGMNRVSRRDARTGIITTIDLGEPEPTGIVVDRRGDLYWTCRSAGVIVRHSRGVTRVILAGLNKPVGITVDDDAIGRGELFFTEIPTPGVAGGMNGVFRFDGAHMTVIHMGEPEPTFITIDDRDTLYWTCQSAGVILKQSGGATSMLLTGLHKPRGIALDQRGNLYFTEVPTPGVPGSMGGQNKVWKYDLRRGTRTLVHAGDPEPTEIAVAPNGTLFWTCTSAGVIVEARPIPIPDDVGDR